MEGAAGRHAAVGPYAHEHTGLVAQVKHIHRQEGVQEWNDFCARADKKTYDPKSMPADFLKAFLAQHRQAGGPSTSRKPSRGRTSQKRGPPAQLVMEAIQIAMEQLKEQGGRGQVHISHWPTRFKKVLGPLRTFLESQTQCFVVHDEGGRSYTVQMTI